ncbi:IS30 family transposase [Pseudomonas sp. FW306-02-F02-AA]|nr:MULTISPECIES: IS30 family transposase [Pseudomonas]PMZ05598.1 IS30 family transposase [Pseudomonas sp. FW306-02-F02-AB]PMZ11167.1 IS30 family transposase [Pseudomonas sp. FW306-02-H06C]PMZ17122.1 IS30 family transposase [Pseudomonas sp. FW306-02-F02-AA]PMZ23368.1 IS30 family transposase [Pseudomonas sp. FW306-02-F08-AA]PMZ29196.1 IS30 family transposase [Pseudomonas sp. FW306-02-F04-BA]
MARSGTHGFSAEQKSELWRLWRKGETLSKIALAIQKPAGTVHTLLARNGGISPRIRHRSRLALTLGEREEIFRGMAIGHSIRHIAGQLNRSPSTVSREVSRNQGRGLYRATDADAQAWTRGLRPKPYRLNQSPELCEVVSSKLKLYWSPEQISGWLKREYPDAPAMQISHETLYRSLFIQARGVLKKELVAVLRSRRMMRRAKTATSKGQPRGHIIDAVSISERPAEVADRAIPGHWEGDLITGSKNSHIATLVERTTRFLVLVRVEGKDTKSVVDGLIREVQQLPEQLWRSLTWDRGTELAQHKRFTLDTNINVFFCDPRSPWQRGTNENTNGLLRQYFRNGTDLSGYSQSDLNVVALQMNQRPRKTLDFETPADRLQRLVAPTG